MLYSVSFFFFFSSRRRHTRCSRDWSSDVCSSDLGGLTYAIDPAQALGRRISDIRVGAQPLEPARRYKTAGWASVATEADGPPAWDVVADHLRRLGRIRLDPRPRVRVV